MKVTATQLPNAPIWSVSVPGFHCAVAMIRQDRNGFHVSSTKPGVTKFPQTADIDMDRFRSLDDAVNWIQEAL